MEGSAKSNALQIFEFRGVQVRLVLADGEPKWVLRDVCDVLDLGSPHKVAERLDEDEKGRSLIPTPGGMQEMAVVNESGLYNVIIRSDKPEAKEFKRLVTHEILPQIRKTGKYVSPNAHEKTLDEKSESARRLEIMEKNADWRRAKLMFDMLNRYGSDLTPETKTVFLAEAAALASGHPMLQALPAAAGKMHTAGDLGGMFGVSANKIGRVANDNGLKAPEGQSNGFGTWVRSKSPNSPKEILQWVYYDKAVEWFGAFFENENPARQNQPALKIVGNEA
jgi:prophage antirepressor-like protein